MKRLLPIALLFLQIGCSATSTEEAEQAESSEDAITRAQCRGAVGETDQRCRIEGTVESVFSGEMDPYVVGDVCVTFVKVGSKRYGLVTAQDVSCRTDLANQKVSFSNGALDLSSRSRAKVLKEYDANATYYEFNGKLRTIDPNALATFDALDDAEKVEFLYDVSPGGDWASLRPGFTQKPIRIVDTLTGQTKSRALDAYGEIAPFSYQNGGDQPDVFAIQKDGVTFAYGIAASGRSYGNWATLMVFDREFNELERFSYAD